MPQVARANARYGRPPAPRQGRGRGQAVRQGANAPVADPHGPAEPGLVHATPDADVEAAARQAMEESLSRANAAS
eukprot:14308705-Alexandrium_andersonii.AAC.1